MNIYEFFAALIVTSYANLKHKVHCKIFLLFLEIYTFHENHYSL